jgi:hypothetical protein
MSPEEWSVVWEAVAAVGTVGAVGWAVFTTLAERRKRTEAERELTAEKAASREAKRREQADHVAVWFDVSVGVLGATGTAERSTLQGSVFVGNYSGAPIFNVEVFGVATYSNEVFELGYLGVIPPGSDPWSDSLGAAAEYEHELRVHADFQDVAGVWWRRTSVGKLEEIGRHPLP